MNTTLINARSIIIVLTSTFSFALSFSLQTSTELRMTPSSIDESKPFALNVKKIIRPEKRDEWLKQIKDDQICSRRDEEGCLQFSLSEDTDSPNTFFLHEQYVNQAAFLAHTQTSHFKHYDNYCTKENPFAEDPEIFFFQPLDEGPKWSKVKREIPKTAFCVTVNLYPKEEVRDEFLRIIGNNKKGTDETEPLALQYTYGESTSMPNVFHFHEQYAGGDGGKAGFDAHASSSHFQEWESFAATNPFAKEPEVFFSRIIED